MKSAPRSRLCAAVLTVSAAAFAVSAGFAQTPPPPATPAAAAPPAITVSVDGTPLAFAGQGPIVRGGSVLVPLRGVFERLGAGVQYSGATHTIIAVKGETTVSLRLGDASAIVNGTPRPLAAPAQTVGGTTLVPLRFVSEALGAQVKWDEASQTVLVTTPRPAPVLNTPVAGAVVAVLPDENALTVQPATGDPVKVVLLPDARILARAGDAAPVGATLATIRPGDQVAIRRDNDGKAYDVEADYEERRGELKAIDPSATVTGGSKITFADDTSVETVASAPLTMGSLPFAASDVKPGARLVLRVNPTTHLATAITVEIPKVEIASLTQSAGERMLKSGDEVTVTLVGTPAGKATFTVGEVPALSAQPLAEASPGTYTATFKVPAGLNLPAVAVSGSLALLGGTSVPATAAPTLKIDSVPPTVAKIAPAETANTTELRPDISGTFDDRETGVEASTIQIAVNGKEVTAQAKVTDGFFLYKPAADLPPGPNTVAVTVSDKAGNQTRREWSFTVTPVFSPLKVVVIDPEGRTLGTGDILRVRAEAAPGGTAKWAITGTAVGGSLTEETPGVYVGTYGVRRGDSITNGQVVVTFTPPGGAADVTLASARTVSLSAGAPRPPIIDTPQDGASVGNYVTVSGRAQPGSTVRLSLRYDGKLLILNKSGNLASVDLKVGADGLWTSGLLTLSTPRGASDLTITAEALAVTPAGETSETATVRFRK